MSLKILVIWSVPPIINGCSVPPPSDIEYYSYGAGKCQRDLSKIWQQPNMTQSEANENAEKEDLGCANLAVFDRRCWFIAMELEF